MLLRHKFFTVKPSPRDGIYAFLTNGTQLSRYTLQTDVIVPLSDLSNPSGGKWTLGNSVFALLGPGLAGYTTTRYNFASGTSGPGPNYQGVPNAGTLGGGGSSNADVGFISLVSSSSASYGTTNRIVFAAYTFTATTKLINGVFSPGSMIGSSSVAIAEVGSSLPDLQKYVYATEALSVTTSLLVAPSSGNQGTSLRAEAFGLFIVSSTSRVTNKYTYATDGVTTGTALLGTTAFIGGGGNGVTGVLSPQTAAAPCNKYTYAADTVISTVATGRTGAQCVMCDGTLGVNV